MGQDSPCGCLCPHNIHTVIISSMGLLKPGQNPSRNAKHRQSSRARQPLSPRRSPAPQPVPQSSATKSSGWGIWHLCMFISGCSADLVVRYFVGSMKSSEGRVYCIALAPRNFPGVRTVHSFVQRPARISTLGSSQSCYLLRLLLMFWVTGRT